MPQPPKKVPIPLSAVDTNIGARIAHFRKQRAYTQAALANVLGISRKQVVDYETGRIHLNDEMIIRFALTLQVSSDELLGIKPVKSSDEEPSLRFSKRFKDITKLPEDKKKAILKILDDLIRANN